MRKPLQESKALPPTSRNRSPSSATDQKTLVASMPNSPQHARFHMQQEMGPAFFAKLAEANNPLRQHQPDAPIPVAKRQPTDDTPGHQKSTSTEKALPLPPPSDTLLPPALIEQKNYTINVNIDKNMISEDLNFTKPEPPRESGVSRERMPKYRFEEYHPPIVRTPPMSLAQTASKRTSEYEMGPYPRKDSASDAQSFTEAEEDGDDDKTQLRRKKTLKKLESKPPQLPPPDLPPPSPSFSFNSYDWYQNIIEDEGIADDSSSRTPTPSLPERNPARTPTQATFGASLFSKPSDAHSPSSPRPLSSITPPALRTPSQLHPKTAAPPGSVPIPSPTSTKFRLSPIVYTTPSRPSKVQTARSSLQRSGRQSTVTQKSHTSRSWLPDDGLYLPEEGTHDSYMIFKRRPMDDSRPTSYTPL